jgi:hypothetical protein
MFFFLSWGLYTGRQAEEMGVGQPVADHLEAIYSL